MILFPSQTIYVGQKATCMVGLYCSLRKLCCTKADRSFSVRSVIRVHFSRWGPKVEIPQPLSKKDYSTPQAIPTDTTPSHRFGPWSIILLVFNLVFILSTLLRLLEDPNTLDRFPPLPAQLYPPVQPLLLSQHSFGHVATHSTQCYRCWSCRKAPSTPPQHWSQRSVLS